jgi:2-oxoglutarate ferredoxin oxidoreductase subunit gamma
MIIVRICGFGGQGVVLAARLLGVAAALSGKYVVQAQSYGAAARGGASRADITVSDEPIYDISPLEVDVLVSMSQPAYQQYIKTLKKDGLLIFDSALVKPTRNENSVGVDATRYCKKQFGRALFANIFFVGFIAGILELLDLDSLKSSIKEELKRDIEKNLEALESGYLAGSSNRTTIAQTVTRTFQSNK